MDLPYVECDAVPSFLPVAIASPLGLLPPTLAAALLVTLWSRVVVAGNKALFVVRPELP
jgi:hypothetical protein